jgi:hypothetical protein
MWRSDVLLLDNSGEWRRRVPALLPATWMREVTSGELCTLSDAVLSICGVWSVWTGRKAKKHGKGSWNPQVAVPLVAAMVDDLMCLQASKPGGPPLAKKAHRAGAKRHLLNG